MRLREAKRLVFDTERRYKTAQDLITETILAAAAPTEDVDIVSAYDRSKRLLGDYVTLDLKHREDILQIIKMIREYAKDRTRLRPLNIMMQAEPGSGKSHFVKCLANKLNMLRAAAVDFNMGSMQNIDDFVQPLETVRNLKVHDNFPILFLDEFDSDPKRYPILLPLLWDGELRVGHRDLKLGKLVIILAGSDRKIEKAMKAARKMQTTNTPDRTKLVDLLSRINGGELNIPPLDLAEENRDRRIDKVCITVALLQQRFSNSLQLIPWSFLRFVAFTSFRYGVRSIAHLVDFVTPPEEESHLITLENLQLPLNSVKQLDNSSLSRHVVSDNGPASIVKRWQKALTCTISVRVSTEDEDRF